MGHGVCKVDIFFIAVLQNISDQKITRPVPNCLKNLCFTFLMTWRIEFSEQRDSEFCVSVT